MIVNNLLIYNNSTIQQSKQMSSGTDTATATTKRHLGVVSYKASTTEEPHKGDIVVSTTSGKNITKLRHEGNEWANAL